MNQAAKQGLLQGMLRANFYPADEDPYGRLQLYGGFGFSLLVYGDIDIKFPESARPVSGGVDGTCTELFLGVSWRFSHVALFTEMRWASADLNYSSSDDAIFSLSNDDTRHADYRDVAAEMDRRRQMSVQIRPAWVPPGRHRASQGDSGVAGPNEGGTRYDMFNRKRSKPAGHITLGTKSAGKPCEVKPHVRFDEKALEIGLEGNFTLLRQCFTLPS